MATDHVPQSKEEKEFVKAAQASARMPSTDNRKKARKAFNKLPEDSPFKKYKFEG
jgi:hypothetical protein